MKQDTSRRLLFLAGLVVFAATLWVCLSQHSLLGLANDQVSSSTHSAVRSLASVDEPPQHQQEQEQEERSLAHNNNVQMVFFVGLEGAGHHLVKQVAIASPALARIENMEMAYSTERLQQMLYPTGLWDAHCDTSHEIDVSIRYIKLVRQLDRVSRKVNDVDKQQTVLLNIEHGNVAYPTDTEGDCRELHYPELDSLYMACDEAGVRCGHVYLYRDPYEIVNSANRRGFNPTVLSATKLYYSMLNIIYSQFSAYPERTLGCWGFWDTVSPDSHLWDSVRDMFGWTDQVEFEATIREVVYERNHLSDENRTALVPPELDVYMQSLVRSHNRTLDLCRKQARGNGFS